MHWAPSSCWSGCVCVCMVEKKQWILHGRISTFASRILCCLFMYVYKMYNEKTGLILHRHSAIICRVYTCKAGQKLSNYKCKHAWFYDLFNFARLYKLIFSSVQTVGVLCTVAFMRLVRYCLYRCRMVLYEFKLTRQSIMTAWKLREENPGFNFSI